MSEAERMKEAYTRAARICLANRTKHVLNERPVVHWIAGSEDFWFERDIVIDEEKLGKEYCRYCHGQKAVKKLFDHERFRLAIPELACHDVRDLPITVHEVDGIEEKLWFSVKDTEDEYLYDLAAETVEKLSVPLHAQGQELSPNRKYALYQRDGNLFLREAASDKHIQLTFDGGQDITYAERYRMCSEKATTETPRIMPLGLKWSADSRYALSYKIDAAKTSRLHLLQSVPIDGSPVPKDINYPYSFPMDEEILTAQVLLIDIKTKQVEPVLLGEEPLTLFTTSMFDAAGDQVKWSADGKTAYLVRYDRYYKNAQAVFIDVESRTARIAAEQSYETFGFTEYYGMAAQEKFLDSGLFYIPSRKELIWLLEREEYGSLYVIDADSGTFKYELTPGDFTVRRIRYYDPEAEIIYFSASGVKEGIDPYYQYLCSVPLGGGAVKVISKEDADHTTLFSPEGRYFVDTFSTLWTLPRTEVFDLHGEPLCHVAEADISRILEKGYIAPEPFTALARDGKTELHGILMKPYDFDPQKKYPVIDYVYGGSQRINVPKSFWFHEELGFDPMGGLQSLAHLGFVGIIVDGLATPLRGKSIHDMAYQKPEECCGLGDHVEAIRQLAAKYSWIDTDKVGIWGSSGGGYAAVRGLLDYPEVYKAGVSLCGNQDQQLYGTHWGDRWIGPYSQEAYYGQNNCNFVKNLQGHLLLVHGDMDDNVHPSSMMQLADALIKEGKDFDMLLYPNSSHGLDQYPFVIRKRWDFFVRNLLGCEPPRHFQIESIEQ